MSFFFMGWLFQHGLVVLVRVAPFIQIPYRGRNGFGRFCMIHGCMNGMDMFRPPGKFSSLSPEQSFCLMGRIGDLVLFAFLVFGILSHLF